MVISKKILINKSGLIVCNIILPSLYKSCIIKTEEHTHVTSMIHDFRVAPANKEVAARLKIKSAHRTVRATLPTEKEEEYLKIDHCFPILEVEQVAFLDDGRIFEYSKSRHRGDRFELKTVSVHYQIKPEKEKPETGNDLLFYDHCLLQADCIIMKFYFAPMESITIYLYRNIYEQLFGEIDKYYTPFIMPNGKRTFKTREFQDVLPEHNEGLNIVPQILTKNAQDFIRTAKELKELGYDEVNLNLGCPSRTVVAKQKGSGFLREPEVLDDFLTEIYEALDMKISIKTRIGLREPEEFEEILSIYNRHPVYELTIHPRLQQEFYKGKPHLGVFEYATKHSENPLCYNGDIVTKQDYDHITDRFKDINAVMIGRGLLRNPALVREIKYGQKLAKRELLKMHDTLYVAYQEYLSGDKNVLYKMKEFWNNAVVMFTNNEKYAKKIRKVQNLKNYEKAVEALFSDQELINELYTNTK